MDPFLVTSVTVVQFFQFLLDSSSLGYASFNTHRSALTFVAHEQLSNNPIIRRFMKAIFKLRPSKAKYDNTWNPDVVLQHINGIADNSLPFMAKKLVTLLLLASGQRLQTVQAIQRKNLVWTENTVKIFVPKMLKTSGPQRKSPVIVLPKLIDHPNICVFSCMQTYLDMTRSSKAGALFVSLKNQDNPVTTDTLARWTKDILKQAGINVETFSAHSTRHASVSAAARKNVQLDVIFASAGWTPGSLMFNNVYNRPLVDQAAYARSILQQ